ncbi:putative Transposon Tf2-6 polyprotein [Nannochloris sp. 'desiccata']|nr:putative Transposon Tf2-6 polyprotein [Chlorella desiccata (nom. nud.)]
MGFQNPKLKPVNLKEERSESVCDTKAAKAYSAHGDEWKRTAATWAKEFETHYKKGTLPGKEWDSLPTKETFGDSRAQFYKATGEVTSPRKSPRLHNKVNVAAGTATKRSLLTTSDAFASGSPDHGGPSKKAKKAGKQSKLSKEEYDEDEADYGSMDATDISKDKKLGLKQVLGNISLSISEYRGTHSFVVAPLSGFDVILGMDWVDQFTDVTFMPKQQQVQLSTADGMELLLYSDKVPAPSFPLCSMATYERDLRLNQVQDIILMKKLELNGNGLAEVEFLGHLVSANGIRPDPKKVAAIAEWTAPTNVSELKSFTGAVNFHRRHIEHCASIMAPLNKLTKKETPYIWGTEQQAAFDDLKQALISAPVLRPPKFGGMFHLYTDASGVGMGGALYQDFDDGRHPIAFWSSCYTPAQLNYGVPEQELCAVILALKYFEHYLKNAQVTVLSDHMGLSTFLTKKGIKETRRHMRWKDFLAEFDIQIKHIAGRDNVVADALSRRGWLEQLQVNTINVGGSDADNKLLDGWSAACNSDPAIKNLLEKFAAGTLSKKRFAMPDDKLYRLYGSQWCLVVPHSKVHALLHEFHDSPTAGHMGVERTEVSVRRHYWWPTLHADVVKYITHCPHCQRNKPDNQAMYGKMVPVQVPKLPWLAVNIDFFDMPPDEAGMDYALSVTDRMSKMVHILPCMKSITGEGTARLFYDGVFKYHGLPKSIVSDRDSRFTSAFWQELMKILGTDLLMSTAMHPQTDGLAERSHRTIKETLTNWTAANPSNWSQHISSVEFAINNSKQGATGQTPFFLNHGLHPHTPASLLADSVLPASLSPHADDYL